MGKDLKGKELGIGICQRKDGLYCARFVNKLCKRKENFLILFRWPKNGINHDFNVPETL